MRIIKAEEVYPAVKIANYMAVERTRPHRWPRRRMPDFELILSIRGEFEFINHDTAERVIQPPGTILLIWPMEFHSYQLISEKGFFSCIHCELLPGMRYADGDYALDEEPQRLTAGGGDVQDLFRRTAQTFQRNSRFCQPLRDTLVREIWLSLAERWLNAAANPHDVRLDAMLDYLNSNLTAHYGRTELARKFHLTPQHINLIFKQSLGMSPTGYVHRELIRTGYRLLQEEGLSIKETAEKLGFANQFYFSRIFKKVFGVTPSSV
jgi:AraC-like DNA-binding protein